MLGKVSEPQKRDLAAIIFLKLREFYLNYYSKSLENANDTGQELRLRLVKLTPSDDGPETKRRKLGGLIVDPNDDNYDRKAHIDHVLDNWDLGGFDFAGEDEDNLKAKHLFTTLCGREFQVKQCNQLQLRPLQVTMAEKAVHFFTKVFGRDGYEKLSELVSNMEGASPSRSESHGLWIMACHLENGVLSPPTEATIASVSENPAFDPKSSATIPLKAPDSVKELFATVRQLFDLSVRLDRTTEVVQLYRRVSVLESYFRVKELASKKPKQLSAGDKEQQRKLMDYIGKKERLPGRNLVERLNFAITCDLAGPNAIPQDITHDDVKRVLKEMEQGTVLFALTRKFGAGVLALLPASVWKRYATTIIPVRVFATGTDMTIAGSRTFLPLL